MIKVVEKKLRKYHGYADTGTKTATVASNQSDYEYLGTLIHELIHIHFPDLSETNTDRIAKNITSNVWKKGFKR
jgi:hypothetical protein